MDQNNPRPCAYAQVYQGVKNCGTAPFCRLVVWMNQQIDQYALLVGRQVRTVTMGPQVRIFNSVKWIRILIRRCFLFFFSWFKRPVASSLMRIVLSLVLTWSVLASVPTPSCFHHEPEVNKYAVVVLSCLLSFFFSQYRVCVRVLLIEVCTVCLRGLGFGCIYDEHARTSVVRIEKCMLFIPIH